jgi:hypothetical protein
MNSLENLPSVSGQTGSETHVEIPSASSHGGTMGVDRQLPCWIPRQETPRWSRKCGKCLKVEETYNTKDDVRKVPIFR